MTARFIEDLKPVDTRVWAAASAALEAGGGILRLAPDWVPRSFCVPGCRVKLHPDDYYALDGERGGIDERWFSSTTPADNGPLTGAHEGLSFIVFEHGGDRLRIRLRDVVAEPGADLIGPRIRNEHTAAGRCTRRSSTTRARCRCTSITATSTPR